MLCIYIDIYQMAIMYINICRYFTSIYITVAVISVGNRARGIHNEPQSMLHIYICMIIYVYLYMMEMLKQDL